MLIFNTQNTFSFWILGQKANTVTKYAVGNCPNSAYLKLNARYFINHSISFSLGKKRNHGASQISCNNLSCFHNFLLKPLFKITESRNTEK